MLSLFKQPKAQVLLVSNYDVQFFAWEHNALSFIAQFSDSEDGHQAFADLQHVYHEYPAIIITNLIEESFRNDTAPPVSGRDLKALLQRKLEFSFRKTHYRIARVIGKDIGGRKDNRILLSALTKPELLRPWVDALLENHTPIQTITSTAFLAEEFVHGNSELKNEDYLLIISIEHNAELRQTYLRKGRVIFSRLTSLATQDISTLGNGIYKECLQIRNYLERVRLLPYEASLKVKVYSGFDDDELKLNRKGNNLNIIECINVEHALAEQPVDLGKLLPGASVYFLGAIIQQRRVGNIYAPLQTRRYFELKKLSTGLIYASLAVIVVSVTVNAAGFLNSLDTLEQRNQLTAQTQPLLQEYNRLSQDFPETPIQSQEMALVVTTAETIESQSYFPSAAMRLISDAMSSASQLSITEIDWRLIGTVSDNSQQPRLYNPQNDPENSFVYAVLEDRTALQVIVRGVAYSPSSYREAQNQVQAFSDSLASNAGVSVVEAQLPTDTRVDTSVSATVDGDELRASFTLRLNIEEP